MSVEINGHSPNIYRAAQLLCRAGNHIKEIGSNDTVPESPLFQSALQDIRSVIELLDPHWDMSREGESSVPVVRLDVHVPRDVFTLGKGSDDLRTVRVVGQLDLVVPVVQIDSHNSSFSVGAPGKGSDSVAASSSAISEPTEKGVSTDRNEDAR